MIVQFLATSSTEDGDHWIFATCSSSPVNGRLQTGGAVVDASRKSPHEVGPCDKVAAIILITANVLKPLIAACCVMAVYILANNLGMALVSDEAEYALLPSALADEDCFNSAWCCFLEDTLCASLQHNARCSL